MWLGNLEKSGNFTSVLEMSQKLTSSQGNVGENYLLLTSFGAMPVCSIVHACLLYC